MHFPKQKFCQPLIIFIIMILCCTELSHRDVSGKPTAGPKPITAPVEVTLQPAVVPTSNLLSTRPHCGLLHTVGSTLLYVRLLHWSTSAKRRRIARNSRLIEEGFQTYSICVDLCESCALYFSIL